MEKKICSKCKTEKEVCEFHKQKNNKSGYRASCKECRKSEKIFVKLYFEKNKEKIILKNKLWLEKNPSYMKEYQKKYNIKNREKLNEKTKKWREKNKEEILKKQRKKINEKYSNNLNFRLGQVVRSRINKVMKFNRNKQSLEILGCSVKEFRNHIENKFQSGMSWENYGYYGWHIDHIIPLSSAKTEKEIYELCHYTNLQPLWAKENLKKSNKLII